MAGKKTVEAVYEDGVLRPLTALDLAEHQRVRVTIDVAAEEPPNEALQGWLGVYEGLADEDIAEVGEIALDRGRFMRPPK